MDQRFHDFIETLEADALSGATAIVANVVAWLVDAADSGDIRVLARACADAQPAMAGLIALERVVRTSPDLRPALERFGEQVRRAPASIARYAVAALQLRPGPAEPGMPGLRIVTCSRSAAVEATLVLLAGQARVRVACAESRPKREGTSLAERLAALGLAVELFSDAAISSAIPGSDALVVGADAIAPDFFVNKVGTAALCALAQVHGVPVLVLAGREKVLSAAEVVRLGVVEGPAEDVAAASAPGLTVRNPYFERIPLRLVSQIVSDRGVQNTAL